MIKLPLHRAFWASLVAIAISTSAMAAQSPNSGLGQAWPNARDVSASTHWHVYVFASNGVRYIQINDLGGGVRGALATANGQFLVLPMGRDAQHIATPQHSLERSETAVPLDSYAETIYRDGSIRVTAVPLSDGSMAFTAAFSTTSATLAPCDPLDCAVHAN